MHEQSDGHDLKIRVYTNIQGRRREYELPIKLSVFGISPGSWACRAFHSLGDITYETLMILRSLLYNILRVFKIVSENKDITAILNLARDELHTQDIYLLYGHMERSLRDHPFKIKTARCTLSGAFRWFVKHHLPSSSVSPIAIESIRYRSEFPQIRTPRSTLDLIQTTERTSSSLLGAVEFQSHGELIQKSLKILTDDLNLIISACRKDLDYFKELRDTLSNVSKIQIPEQAREFVENYITKKHTTSRDEKIFGNTPSKIILSAYLDCTRRLKLNAAGARRWQRYKSADLFESAGIKVLERLPSKHVFDIINRLSNFELEVIMLLLLCRTGWNRDSLLNLTTLGVKKHADGSYQLQGFKSKTGDHTPIIVIDKKEIYEIRAIRLLLWNRLELIRLKYIAREDTKLWYGWSVNNEKLKVFPISLYGANTSFRTRHTLPHFCSEQIRTQVLNIKNYERRNIEDTRRLAGHTSISTTGTYLNQIVNYNINSSINYDFQKKLESKIKLNIGKRQTAQLPPGSKLTPIGDGTMCKDPTNPPNNLVNLNGLCPATSCHLGDGCTNRVIIIDFERAEEIIRTKRYYRDNWKRLYVENKENFEKNIASAMLFNTLLYDFIKSTAHGHSFTKIERAIFDE